MRMLELKQLRICQFGKKPMDKKPMDELPYISLSIHEKNKGIFIILFMKGTEEF